VYCGGRLGIDGPVSCVFLVATQPSHLHPSGIARQLHNMIATAPLHPLLQISGLAQQPAVHIASAHLCEPCQAQTSS
jgi:hypothetical protein